MLFDLTASRARDFGSFVTGKQQAEARGAAEQAAAGRASAYLWGKPGIGKSHLLAAAANHARAAGLKVSDFGTGAATSDLVIIDGIEQATMADQDELLTLLKACLQDGRTTILAAGTDAPRQLKLRDDVRSRLEALPAFRLLPLPDLEMRDTLIQHARHFGRDLDKEVANLLVQSLPRNLGYLTRVLTDLDAHAIATQEPLTSAFARRWINHTLKLR